MLCRLRKPSDGIVVHTEITEHSIVQPEMDDIKDKRLTVWQLNSRHLLNWTIIISLSSANCEGLAKRMMPGLCFQIRSVCAMTAVVL